MFFEVFFRFHLCGDSNAKQKGVDDFCKVLWVANYIRYANIINKNCFNSLMQLNLITKKTLDKWKKKLKNKTFYVIFCSIIFFFNLFICEFH